METMQLIHTATPADLTTVGDAALETWFAEAGLGVEVVDHCDAASCPICFTAIEVPAAA
ncbi:MAG: hypothetical protein ACR2N2_10205 [Acidimicrobiia bacterium]